MDIERLEELKEVLNHSLFYFGRKSGKTNFPDTLFDVMKLIDEAIARQSATSEEVQRAIEILKLNLDLEKMINENGDIENQTYLDAIDLAITALQAYQPTISKTETNIQLTNEQIDRLVECAVDLMKTLYPLIEDVLKTVKHYFDDIEEERANDKT